MAYTRAWTTTVPADTDQASTLGAVSRNLRVDIGERMDTLLNSHWSDDPVGGFPVTVVLNLPASAGRESGAGWTSNIGSGTQMIPTGLVTAAVKLIHINVPVGCTLTKIRASMFILTGAAGSPNMHISGFFITPSGGGSTPVSPTFTSANPAHDSTWHWMDIAIAPYTVLAGDQITVNLQGNNGAGGASGDVIYGGLEVTYTKPHLLAAV